MSTPLTNDYKHTLYFTSKQAQVNYFLPKAKFTTDMLYLRKDKSIKFPRDYEELINNNINYVMYRQPGGKWYYAFITDMQFISEGVTELTLETDVMQTWFMGEDYNVLPSFIEREHTDDDTIGKNLVPEGLDTGDFITEYVNTPTMFNNLCIVVSSTLDPEMQMNGGQLINGIYSGTTYYAVALNENGANEVNKFLSMYNKGDAEAIHAIFIAPSELITGNNASIGNVMSWIGNIGGDNLETKPFSQSFTVGTGLTIGGYTPNNNKLFTNPYNYYMVLNNQGGSAIYQREFFEGTPSFKVVGTLTPGGSIRCIPENYKGVAENYAESVTLGKFPMCSWVTDTYTNWLTQNATNIALNTFASAVTTVGGLATGNLTAAGMGALQIGNTLADMHQRSMVPPQLSGNTNSGDVICSANKNRFIVYRMTITEEYARIIDRYFDVYGYKCNQIKEPNIEHRVNYWYTKTIDINIENHKVPIKDLAKIKECYNNGITFWKNASYIGNYNVDNGII